MMDWDKIRQDYVCGRGSQRMLAQKYGVNLRTLSRRAVREDWTGQRREYRMALFSQNRAEEEFWLDGVRDAANILTDTVNRALNNPDQVYLNSAKDSKAGEKLLRSEKADVSEVQKWAGVVRELSAIMRNLYDVPGIAERQQVRLQERKLELEEKRLSPAAEDHSQDRRVFIPRQDWGEGEP